MRPLALLVPLLLVLATQASADDPPTRRLSEDWESGDDGWYVYAGPGEILCTETTHGCIYGLGGSLSTTDLTPSHVPPYAVGAYQLDASFIPPRGTNAAIGIMINSDVDEQLQLVVHATGYWELKLDWISTSIVRDAGSASAFVNPRDGWLTLRMESNSMTGELVGTLFDDHGTVLKQLKLTGMRPTGLARNVVIVGALGPTGTPTFVDDVKFDVTL